MTTSQSRINAQQVSGAKRRFPSSWSLKVWMAISGSLGVIFVAIHLFGNLKVYSGAEHFNAYAHWLRHAFEPFLPAGFVLWAMRIIMALALTIHVVSAGILWARGRRARGPRRAKLYGWRAFSASLMPLTGVLLLLFVVIHILDLTTGTKPVASSTFQAPTGADAFAYQNLVASFERPWMAAFYVIIMVLLALHISHGAVTMSTDFGIMGHRLRQTFVVLGAVLAVAILLGNASIPLAVQLGVIG